MRTDLVLNYQVLDNISERIWSYYQTIHTMQQALKSLKTTLQEQESEAIRELENKLNAINVNFDKKLITLKCLKNILDDYVEDMEELVGAESRGKKVRADKLDIWYNIGQIESPVNQLDIAVAATACGYSSWAPFGETSEMKCNREKQERNYQKLESLRANVLVHLAGRLKSNVTDIWDIYNSYIKPFEDKDDTYRAKLNVIYNGHTSSKDKRENFWDGFKSISGAFLKSFTVAFVAAFAVALAPGWLVVGTLVALAVGCVIMANVPKQYVPSWMQGAKDAADGVAQKAVEVLEEGPMVLVEDIGQGLADQVQTPEGIATVAGETIGGIAGGFAGAKVKTKIRAGKTEVSKYDKSFDELDTDVDEIELSEGTWDEGPVTRGKEIDKKLGNNTGDTYPVVDKIDKDGVVTSVKSRDLNCKTYKNGSKLKSRIKKDIDKLVDFKGARHGKTKILAEEIKGKQLQMVVPDKSLSLEQIEAINEAIAYGKKKGIKVIITVGR